MILDWVSPRSVFALSRAFAMETMAEVDIMMFKALSEPCEGRQRRPFWHSIIRPLCGLAHMPIMLVPESVLTLLHPPRSRPAGGEAAAVLADGAARRAGGAGAPVLRRAAGPRHAHAQRCVSLMRRLTLDVVAWT